MNSQNQFQSENVQSKPVSVKKMFTDICTKHVIVYGWHPQTGTHHQVGYMSSDVGVPCLVGLILIDTWEWMGVPVHVLM